MSETTVYEVVGGQPFFDALIERFSARVESVPALRRIYPEDLDAGMRSLALFLGQYWGGPQTYSEQKGHPRLRMRHAPYPIGPAERDAWLAAMLAALDESDAPEVAREMMRDYFVNASTAMINAS